MTNEEIDRVIARRERWLRLVIFRGALAGWMATFAFLLIGLVLNSISTLIFDVGVTCYSFAFTLMACQQWRKYKKRRTFYIWSNQLYYRRLFGAKYGKPTQQLEEHISKIYQVDGVGETLSLHQAFRLLDTYRRQQARVEEVDARLEQLRALRRELEDKIWRLKKLGGNHAVGERNLTQISADYDALYQIARRIRSSCGRLEAILSLIEDAANARQLRRELDELSASLPQRAETIEPTFAVESLEDIERQIGREIETYLQLERETEEHLR